MIVYITGKSGSGKSTIAKALAQKLNYDYVDVDSIVHNMYKNLDVLRRVEQIFGDCIYDENGKFDRKKLGQVYFSKQNQSAKKLFDEYTLDIIGQELHKKFKDNVIIDWAMLPITDFWARGALRVLIKPISDDERFGKLLARDNISKDYLMQREQAGLDYNEDEYDYVFYNDYTDIMQVEFIQKVCDDIQNGVFLTILGTQSPYAKPSNACPSYLLNDRGKCLLLDCGSGSHRFFDFNLLNNLGIVISHLHRDHYNDIYNYMYTSYVFKNQKKLINPVNLYLPREPRAILEDIAREKLSFSNIHNIEENNFYKYGNFQFEFLLIDHSPDVLTYATKITINNKSLVYTGDCSYSSRDKLVNFSKGADILICESSFLREHGFPTICNHLTAYQAGTIARDSGVKKLILTHFWPEEDVMKYYNEAKKVFCNVFVAIENDKYLL